jgi:hypothetical protein
MWKMATDSREITLNFFDALSVSISGMSGMSIPVLNCKYLHFADHRTGAPDIKVDIGRFAPSLDNTVCIDNRYFVKDNYIYWHDNLMGLGFSAEISGLDHGPCRVRLYGRWTNRVKFPWCFFPDLILQLYVLHPLIERRLALKGINLLHSAGVCRKNAILIAGRGGSYKTTFSMHMVREGYRLLGDDFVAIRSGNLLPFPAHIDWFRYLARFHDTEKMNIYDQLKFCVRLLAKIDIPSIPIASSATPGKCILIQVANVNQPRIRTLSNTKQAMAFLTANHMLESHTYVSHGYVIGKFLDVYQYCFPDSRLCGYWREWDRAVSGIVQQSSVEMLTVPLRWTQENINLLQKALN